MRRPTVCSSVDPVDDCFCSEQITKKEESRLLRVKRILTGSLLMGRRGKIFGLRLEELPVEGDGIPKITIRLCGYIEVHGSRCGGLFRLSGGNPKLVERLRLSFDRTGDADLESAGDVTSVASLLKLWLRELPEPIIHSHVATALLQIQEKFHEERSQWLEAVCTSLKALPAINIRLLCYLLRFLHHYNQRVARFARCNHHTSGGVAAIFSPLLIEPAVEKEGIIINVHLSNQLMNRLISESFNICRECNNGNSVPKEDQKGDLLVPINSQEQVQVLQHQRKRKECQEIFALQLQDRKVIRSTSEERPLEESAIDNKNNIRRVSSHEDFSKTKDSLKNISNRDKKNKINGHQQESTTKIKDHSTHRETFPLNEHNSSAVVSPHVIYDYGSKYAPCIDHRKTLITPVEYLEDSSHEKRRNAERFARSVTPKGRRNITHRRRGHKTVSDRRASKDANDAESLKENKVQDITPLVADHQGINSFSSDDDDSSQGASSCSSSSHSFLHLHLEEHDHSPSPPHSPGTPPLDFSTLHQQVDCSEPITSLGNWSFSHYAAEEEPQNNQVMLSPRSSMILTRHAYLDPSVPPSPPQEHNIVVQGISTDSKTSVSETRIKKLTKEMNSLKKKLKRYEEEFEKHHGYRPSHADKLSNKDIKKVCSDITKIRKELKCLKENSEISVLQSSGKDLSHPNGNSSFKMKTRTMGETLRDVEKHLAEKRKLAGRPEDVDQLTREQLIDEKVSLQKGLLYMENLFGRPVTKEDRDMVRPLYDRYRVLKRLMIRYGCSKLKDSMSELATIMEHETMDFTNSPPDSSLMKTEKDTVTAQSDVSVPQSDVSVPQSDILWQNLHSLPLSELLEQQRATKEEKKQLRRTLREFEEEFQRKTGEKLQKEDRTPIDTIYSSYKQAKAKLRLLEALVAKQT